jgi:hypothetical protein
MLHILSLLAQACCVIAIILLSFNKHFISSRSQFQKCGYSCVSVDVPNVKIVTINKTAISTLKLGKLLKLCKP